MTQLYPNAFGRIRVYPAETDDLFLLEHPKKDGELIIRNRSAKEMKCTLLIRHHDYFGLPLGEERHPLAFPGGGKTLVKFNIPANRWKTAFAIERNGKSGSPHYLYPRAGQWYTARPEVLKLKHGWSFAPGGKENTPGAIPESGWREAKGFPVALNPKIGKSHFLWMRRNIQIPDGWTGKKIFLAFPDIRCKGDIFVDSKRIASRFLWETPCKLDLTSFALPGKQIRLELCITDYIAALQPGTKIPDAGIYGTSAKSLAAAVGWFPDGGYPALENPPELLAEPEIRVDHAWIKTILTKKRIEVDAELVNDTGTAGSIILAMEILHAGKKVMSLPEKD